MHYDLLASLNLLNLIRKMYALIKSSLYINFKVHKKAKCWQCMHCKFLCSQESKMFSNFSFYLYSFTFWQIAVILIHEFSLLLQLLVDKRASTPDHASAHAHNREGSVKNWEKLNMYKWRRVVLFVGNDSGQCLLLLTYLH